MLLSKKSGAVRRSQSVKKCSFLLHFFALYARLQQDEQAAPDMPGRLIILRFSNRDSPPPHILQ